MFLQLLTALSLLKVVLGVFCDQTFTTSSGTVSSPSFSTSSSYADNQNCEYDIQVSSGSGIKLSWQTFDIKGNMPNCYDDYVEIYIGCARRSIGKYCSENGGYKPFDVYSPDSCLHIKFHSDSSGSGTGFQAYYSSYSLFSGTSGVGADCWSYSERYPKTLSSTSGVISSPRWPQDYPTLRDCYWRIEVGSRRNIKIAFMDFDLEFNSGCGDDKVKVKGGDDDDSYDRSNTVKDSMCGRKSPFYFTSSEDRIWIRFKSDSFISDRGFVAGYVMYDSTTSGKSSAGSTVAIVVCILVMFVVAACIYHRFIYKKRLARRAQQQRNVAHVTVSSQQVTLHPPPPPQPGYVPPPQQGYTPPPQPGYAPPPQPGYAPPPQPGYAPLPETGYAPPNQPPPPYSQVAGTPYPQQDKSGLYPAAPPGGAPPYPPGQPGVVPPYPTGQPGAAPPYPPGKPGAAPPYPAGQPGGVPPYPPEQPPGGAAPYPSAPSIATAPPYPPQ